MRLLVYLLPLGVLPVVASGQEDDAAFLSVRALAEGVERPTIDGRLDDAAWQGMAEITELRQVEPEAGAVPSQRTRIRLGYDKRSIFMAVECFDTVPAEVRATQRRRDARLDPDDRIEFLFDTFLDRRNGFWFQLGAGGSKGDALITRNGARFNKEWDGIWYGRSRRTTKGWVAEVEIPVATLNFDPGATRWGFNIRRHIRRFNEEARWASPQPRLNFFGVANAGTIDGLKGLEQGVGLDLVPFAVADYRRISRDRDDARRGREFVKGDAGLDLFYNLSPNFKVSASVNTDFAETEVDERRVNLTRFPLFFPEQRDFFLEDSGNFFFGPAGRRGSPSRGIQPFFSRRIGIDQNGGEVPLAAAIKVTGQTERFSVGLMDVQTEREGGLDAENLFVGRTSINLFEQSDAGFIWAHGDPIEEDRADTYGFDYNYRTNDFLGDRNLNVSTFVLKSDNSGVPRDDMAYYLSASYPNDEVFLFSRVSVVESEFDPALGFVPRRGIKQYDVYASYNPRLHTWVRQLKFGFYPSLVTDSGNNLETAGATVVPFGFELESGDEGSFRIARTTEVLDEPFDIQDGVIVGADRYDETRYQVEFETSSSRLLEVEGQSSFGGFFGGTRTDHELSATLRPGGWGNFGVEYERNDVRLPGGDFIVRIWRARVNFQFSPSLSWSNFVQYDNVSDFVGVNSRLWWIVKPGHDVYFVLNQGWDYRVGYVAPVTTQLTAKMSYTLRF